MNIWFKILFLLFSPWLSDVSSKCYVPVPPAALKWDHRFGYGTWSCAHRSPELNAPIEKGADWTLEHILRDWWVSEPFCNLKNKLPSRYWAPLWEVFLNTEALLRYSCESIHSFDLYQLGISKNVCNEEGEGPTHEERAYFRKKCKEEWRGHSQPECEAFWRKHSHLESLWHNHSHLESLMREEVRAGRRFSSQGEEIFQNQQSLWEQLVALENSPENPDFFIQPFKNRRHMKVVMRPGVTRLTWWRTPFMLQRSFAQLFFLVGDSILERFLATMKTVEDPPAPGVIISAASRKLYAEEFDSYMIGRLISERTCVGGGWGFVDFYRLFDKSFEQFFCLPGCTEYWSSEGDFNCESIPDGLRYRYLNYWTLYANEEKTLKYILYHAAAGFNCLTFTRLLLEIEQQIKRPYRVCGPCDFIVEELDKLDSEARPQKNFSVKNSFFQSILNGWLHALELSWKVNPAFFEQKSDQFMEAHREWREDIRQFSRYRLTNTRRPFYLSPIYVGCAVQFLGKIVEFGFYPEGPYSPTEAQRSQFWIHVRGDKEGFKVKSKPWHDKDSCYWRESKPEVFEAFKLLEWLRNISAGREILKKGSALKSVTPDSSRYFKGGKFVDLRLEEKYVCPTCQGRLLDHEKRPDVVSRPDPETCEACQRIRFGRLHVPIVPV